VTYQRTAGQDEEQPLAGAGSESFTVAPSKYDATDVADRHAVAYVDGRAPP
jgi:hypothetical protein